MIVFDWPKIIVNESVSTLRGRALIDLNLRTRQVDGGTQAHGRADCRLGEREGEDHSRE